MASVDLAEWTVKANDAIVISLYKKAKEGEDQITCVQNFRPAWTYPIVGDEETIFGYKGLQIHLRFNAADMRPHFSYTKRATLPQNLQTDEYEVPNLKQLFEDFLPSSAFSSNMDFVNAVQNGSEDWHPPGVLIQTFKTDVDHQTVEVWKGNLADPLVLALVKRTQVLVPLFIEGGVQLATESTEEREADPLERWTVYFLYYKHVVPNGRTNNFAYIFAGFCTVYRFYAYRPSQHGKGMVDLPEQSVSFLEFPCRSRISQFLIIPPFQKRGNGPNLYSSVYHDLLEDASTFEITVEDPNEAFDLLRDKCDLRMLREKPEFNDITINTSVILPVNGRELLPSNIIDKEALKSIREKYKIAERQFSRMVEMHLMSKLPDSVRQNINPEVEANKNKTASKEDKYMHRLWALTVKSRLCKQNIEQLAPLDRNERIDALQETLQAIELEYALLLSILEKFLNQVGIQQETIKKRKLSQLGRETSTGTKDKKQKLAEEVENVGIDKEDQEMPDADGEGQTGQDEEDIEPSQTFVEEMPASPEVDLLSD